MEPILVPEQTVRYMGKEYPRYSVDYSTEETFKDDLLNRGYCFLNNCVDMGYDYKQHEFDPNTREELEIFRQYFKDTPQYGQIKEDFLKSKVFNLLQEGRSKLWMNNFYYFRIMKNISGTTAHLDMDNELVFATGIGSNFVTIWMPLIDLELEAGPIFVSRRKEKKFSAYDMLKGVRYKRQCMLGDSTQNLEAQKKTHLSYHYREEEYALDIKEIIVKPLKKGDAVLFMGNTPHGSLDNQGQLRSSIDLRVAFDVDETKKGNSEAFQRVI